MNGVSEHEPVVIRWRVTLADGRVLYVYAATEEQAIARLPRELPKPPAYSVNEERAGVDSIFQADETDTARLVADVRKAPGT